MSISVMYHQMLAIINIIFMIISFLTKFLYHLYFEHQPKFIKSIQQQLIQKALNHKFITSYIITQIIPQSSMRYNPGHKNYLQLNTILKNKKVEESDFRVHFTLMGLYSPDNVHQNLINTVATKVNPICRVHIVQICNEVDDHIVDVSIGLFNDNEAYDFLSSKKTIKFMDENKQERQYTPVISRAFQSYMKKVDKLKEKNQKQIEETPIPPNPIVQSIEQEAPPVIKVQIQPKIRSDSGSHHRNLQDTHRQKHKMEVEEELPKVKKTNCLWLFGIPSQFGYEDIEKVFSNKDIKLIEGKWETYDHMEYLEVILLDLIPIPRVFQQLFLKVENFPFITIPKLQSPQHIMSELSKFIAEFTFKNVIDEQNVIYSLDEIGGVNVLIKNVYSHEKEVRYLAVLNNVSNVERAKVKLTKEYRCCYVNTKAVHMRVGRLLKQYTFENLVIELSKKNPKNSKSSYY